MEEKLVSRRGFIMGAAAAATGAALLGSPLAFAADEATIPPVGQWPYAPLDPDAVGASAWAPPGCGGCGGKSAGALIYALRTALPGGPWDKLPVNIGAFANGGGPFGTSCGGVAGPFLIMQLIGKQVATDPVKWASAAGDLGTAFHQWYCDFPFPSTDWDHLTTFTGTVTSVSGSPLCHESRSQWENVYLRQWDPTTPYDGTRCTKLPCDTVKKAVQMLNDWWASPAAIAWAPAEDFATCYGCHTQLNTDHKVGAIHPSERENCTNCHTVATKHPTPTKRPSRKTKTVI
jgi:hypothetical protein